MDDFMNIVIVPLGYGHKVIEFANEVGVTDATIIHARGADSAKEGLFSISIEPEEEIVLINATEMLSKRIHDKFEESCKRSGSIYTLPMRK